MKKPELVAEAADFLAARRIVRAAAKGALGTLGEGGAPMVTLAATATDGVGAPLLLLSGLSAHTRNIAADPRVSILFEAPVSGPNPQTAGRVTIGGTAAKSGDPAVAARYLGRHPSAGMYAGFGDFAFYRVEVESAHYVAGFGRALDLGAGVLSDAIAAAAIAAEATALVARINAEEGLAARLAASLKRRGRNWRAVALDGDGVDLALKARVERASFAEPAATPDEVWDRIEALAG